MQVFRYENTTTVYIHCLVFLCRKNSTDSRCRSGCSGNNINSRKRRALEDSGNAQHTGFYKLDSGNILLDAPAAPPKKENEGIYVLCFMLYKESFQGIAVLLVLIQYIFMKVRFQGTSKGLTDGTNHSERKIHISGIKDLSNLRVIFWPGFQLKDRKSRYNRKSRGVKENIMLFLIISLRIKFLTRVALQLVLIL